MNILVIVDDKKILSLIIRGMIEEHYNLITVESGRDGLEIVTSATKDLEYDLIILDSVLCGMDAWEVLKNLRAKMKRTPVLLLSEQSGATERIKELQFGDVNYLARSFSFSELLASVHTIQRRYINSEIIRLGSLEIDFPGYRVTRSGKRIDLTQKEFAILALLVRRCGEVLSRARIAERIWDGDFHGETNVVDVHMHRLRTKIDNSFGNKLIHTVRGIGYVLEMR